MKNWQNLKKSNCFSYLLLFLLLITIGACFLCPQIIAPEIEEFAPQPPTFDHWLLFGSYQGKNLFYVVTAAANITLLLSLSALLLGTILGIAISFCHFAFPLYIEKIISVIVYFPRLFFLLCISAWLKLQQPSTLSFAVWVYLVLLLVITGGIFLAAQTSCEVTALRKKLFVHFASSLPINIGVIFMRHILRNCTSLPITMVKQLRDNVLFVSILTFIGVVHLQPGDLGSLILKYSTSPDVFYQGWWILFFPCAFLAWLIFLFDLTGNYLTEMLQK